MDAKTKKKIEAVLVEAAELAEGGMDEYAAAREALTAQTSDVLKELATAAVVDAVRRRQRSNVLSIEREAVDSPRQQPRSRFVRTPEYYAAMEEIDRRHAERMTTIIEGYARELKAEWTADLLASEFALADGTRVTWGDATIEQHEERAAMFHRNAVANAEGAARHLKAVDELKSKGVPTLADLVSHAA